MSKARDLANSTPGTSNNPLYQVVGVASVSATQAAQYGYNWGATTVTFPASRFTIAPRVLLGTMQQGTSNIPVMSWVTTPSTSSCTIWVWSALSAGWYVNYLAMQASSGSVDG